MAGRARVVVVGCLCFQIVAGPLRVGRDRVGRFTDCRKLAGAGKGPVLSWGSSGGCVAVAAMAVSGAAIAVVLLWIDIMNRALMPVFVLLARPNHGLSGRD